MCYFYSVGWLIDTYLFRFFVFCLIFKFRCARQWACLSEGFFPLLYWFKYISVYRSHCIRSQHQWWAIVILWIALPADEGNSTALNYRWNAWWTTSSSCVDLRRKQVLIRVICFKKSECGFVVGVIWYGWCRWYRGIYLQKELDNRMSKRNLHFLKTYIGPLSDHQNSYRAKNGQI